MVKTKKLQKNLGKGLLAGALEKPEVPDTIKFKKHFKALLFPLSWLWVCL